MSATIHQIYCTHCTFGTSALERREGEIAQRVLGYSVRAGSLGRDEMRKVFRQVERYLYYALPSDAPSDEKLRLDAAKAPRRLIFLPSVGGLQVIGQIAYRQKDTSRDQRVGSYFGHLLISEPKSEPWSVLDCLQLWNAQWVAEDSPTIPFQLKTLASLNDLRAAPRAAIDDAVLISFLTAPAGQPFDDPQQVIPSRWRNISRTGRVSLLAEMLKAYLELGAGRRESVLVVVEPSLAALLFYGVARLIPAGKLRDEISFSTFEPNPDRLQTSLAATTFHDPNNSDLKPDAYRRSGRVINTFLDKVSPSAPRSKGVYARLVLDKLSAQGLASIDDLLSSFQAVPIGRPADLELLAEASAQLPVLLEPEKCASDAAWRDSPLTASFLKDAIRRQLVAMPQNSLRVPELAGGCNGLLLLELLGEQAGSQEDPIMRSLLRNLPPERFSDLLTSPRIPLNCKADAIAVSIARTGQFPENCPHLWKDRLANGSDGVDKRLLPAVLARLDPQVLQQLKPPPTPEHARAFLIGLVQAGAHDPAIRPIADSHVTTLDDEQLVDFLMDHDQELRPFYPDGETQLAKRLRKILFDTPLVPERFIKRLDLLRAWDHFLNNDYEMELWLIPLETIRGEFVTLGNAIAQKNAAAKSRWSKPPSINYLQFGRKLLDAIELAMPTKRYGPDDRGRKKINCLREAGRAVLGQQTFGVLDQSFWAAISDHFDGTRWSETELKKTRVTLGQPGRARRKSQSKLRPPTKIIGMVAALIVLGVLGYAVSVIFGHKPARTLMMASTNSEQSRKTAAVSVGPPPPPSGTNASRAAPQPTNSQMANSATQQTRSSNATTVLQPVIESPTTTMERTAPSLPNVGSSGVGAVPSAGAPAANSITTDADQNAHPLQSAEKPKPTYTTTATKLDGDHLQTSDKNTAYNGPPMAVPLTRPIFSADGKPAPGDILLAPISTPAPTFSLIGLKSPLVEMPGKDSIDVQVKGGGNKSEAVASIWLRDKQLFFSWRKTDDTETAKRWRAALASCVLQIGSDRSNYVALVNDDKQPEVKLQKGGLGTSTLPAFLAIFFPDSQLSEAWPAGGYSPTRFEIRGHLFSVQALQPPCEFHGEFDTAQLAKPIPLRLNVPKAFGHANCGVQISFSGKDTNFKVTYQDPARSAAYARWKALESEQKKISEAINRYSTLKRRSESLDFIDSDFADLARAIEALSNKSREDSSTQQTTSEAIQYNDPREKSTKYIKEHEQSAVGVATQKLLEIANELIQKKRVVENCDKKMNENLKTLATLSAMLYRDLHLENGKTVRVVYWSVGVPNE